MRLVSIGAQGSYAYERRMKEANLQYHLESYTHRLQVLQGGRVGSARGLPVRPPREEQTKHEMKQ